ncbi:hypothetical protein [Marinobacter salexigens]|uniref:hypothetical protein n=1 Tax=Marinobacter salexigens TaxID=1925763 RepID=UPI001290463E|nr:hypothetical protein [Marinobacter salexigens]
MAEMLFQNMSVVRLHKVEPGRLTRDKNFDSGISLQQIRQQNKLAVTADILGTEEDVEEKSGLLRALVTVGLRFVSASDEGEEESDGAVAVHAEVEATFCAVYRYSEKMTDDEIAEFLRFNAVHNVWPFWREHVLRVSAEAKLPRPSIPLMKPKD